MNRLALGPGAVLPKPEPGYDRVEGVPQRTIQAMPERDSLVDQRDAADPECVRSDGASVAEVGRQIEAGGRQHGATRVFQFDWPSERDGNAAVRGIGATQGGNDRERSAAKGCPPRAPQPLPFFNTGGLEPIDRRFQGCRSNRMPWDLRVALAWWSSKSDEVARLMIRRAMLGGWIMAAVVAPVAGRPVPYSGSAGTAGVARSAAPSKSAGRSSTWSASGFRGTTGDERQRNREIRNLENSRQARHAGGCHVQIGSARHEITRPSGRALRSQECAAAAFGKLARLAQATPAHASCLNSSPSSSPPAKIPTR